MKVKCKSNNIKNFKDKNTRLRLQQYIRMPDGEIDLCINKEYTVYGIIFRDNSPWYYICPEGDDDYPKPFANECFEVLNDNISKYWKLSVQKDTDGKVFSSFVFHEWATNSKFYENLINGDNSTEKIFREYRRLMDSE